MKVSYELRQLYIVMLSNRHTIEQVEQIGNLIEVYIYWSHYIDIRRFRIDKDGIGMVTGMIKA